MDHSYGSTDDCLAMHFSCQFRKQKAINVIDLQTLKNDLRVQRPIDTKEKMSGNQPKTL